MNKKLFNEVQALHKRLDSMTAKEVIKADRPKSEAKAPADAQAEKVASVMKKFQEGKASWQDTAKELKKIKGE